MGRRLRAGVGWGAVLFALALPAVASNYWMRIIVIAIIQSLMILGLNFILGVTGQLSLGHAAFFGIGAYTSALLTAGRSGSLFWVTMPLAGLVAGAIAVLVGVPTLRLKGHYLALATAGFGEAVKLVLVNWDKVTRGPDGITNIPSPMLLGIEFASNVRMYYLALAVAGAMGAAGYALLRSSYGRAMRAIKQNEIAAEAMGVDAMRVKLTAFLLSAAYAGVAGALYAHASNYISPDYFGFDLTALALMGLMIGGAGSIAGPLIGGALVTLLPEVFRAFKVAYMLVFGIAVMALMGLMPDGIAGLPRQVRWRPVRETKPVGSAAHD